MARKRRERTDRWAALAADPATLRAICDHVAEGGSLPEWCRAHDVRFADVNAWLSADKRRAELYQAARTARDEFLDELVIRNLRLFADLDLGRAYDKDGELLPLHKMPEDIRRAITKVEVTEEFAGRGESREHIGYTKKIRTVSPERALELLGKYRRKFVDRVEHAGKLTLEELVGGSMNPTDPGKGAP